MALTVEMILKEINGRREKLRRYAEMDLEKTPYRNPSNFELYRAAYQELSQLYTTIDMLDRQERLKNKDVTQQRESRPSACPSAVTPRSAGH